MLKDILIYILGGLIFVITSYSIHYTKLYEKKLVVLEISTTNRTAYTNGYVELVDPNIFSKQEAVQISIICPNAFFSSDIVLEEDLGISESLFEFPFENPSLTLKLIEFGRVGTNLTYSGDEPTGFLLTCTFSGSASDPIFVNFSTGELMSLTYDFIAGDVITSYSIHYTKLYDTPACCG